MDQFIYLILNSDSTKTILSPYLDSLLSPIVIITALILLVTIITFKIIRKQTKPRLTNAKLNLSEKSTLSFNIANLRQYRITLLKMYYRILYLGFIPSRKIRFHYGWDYPISSTDPETKITVIENEQEFIIPLANNEPILKRKCKIYAKTTGGICKGISHAHKFHKLAERLEKEWKSKQQDDKL